MQSAMAREVDWLAMRLQLHARARGAAAAPSPAALHAKLLADVQHLQRRIVTELPAAADGARDAAAADDAASEAAAKAAMQAHGQLEGVDPAELDGEDGCVFAEVKWVRCTSRDHHHSHVFCASATSPNDLFCIFCAEGGGSSLTQDERKQIARTHRRAHEAIAAASHAVNMPSGS